MDRFSLAQIGFNLVFLVNIFYLHRKLAALRRPLEGAGVNLGNRPDGSLGGERDVLLAAVRSEERAPHEHASTESAIAGAAFGGADLAQPARRLSWRERRAAARAVRKNLSILKLGEAARAGEGEDRSVSDPSLNEPGAAPSLAREGAAAKSPTRDAPALAARPASPSRPASLDDLIAAAERAESGAALQARVRAGSPAQPQTSGRGRDLAAVESRKANPETWWAEVQAGPARSQMSAGSSAASSRDPESGTSLRAASPPTIVDASRQRAAEDLRANIRRLQMRYEESTQRRGAAGGSGR